jgi:hypothetical protein
MPSTYEPIATHTTTTNGTSSFTFSSIPSTYTDLVLVCSLKATSTNSSLVARFNGISTNTYSVTQLYGNGSSAVSQRLSNQTEVYLSYGGFPTANFAPTIIQLMNYSNTTTNKTFLSRSGFASGFAETSVGLWRNTAAISSMTLFAGTAYDTGCTFTLYGIKAA